MTVTTSIRVATKARFVELLIEKLAAVQVSYGWPQDLEDECVWVGAATGPVTIPSYRAGRATRDDTFTVEVHFMAAKPGQTAQDADRRVEELYSALEDICADNPSLGGLDGLKYAAQLGGDVEFEFVRDVPVELPVELVHGRPRDDDADVPGIEGLLAQVEYRDGEASPVWELVSVAKAERAKREKNNIEES